LSVYVRIESQINLQLTGKSFSSSTSAQVCFYNKLNEYAYCKQTLHMVPVDVFAYNMYAFILITVLVT